MKRIVFTVTNDLNFDQRMIRICTSLQQAGYEVTLIGRKINGSLALRKQPFSQKRLFCFFQKGPLFYAEYNLRLFFHLLLQPMDVVGAIDLDTILPCLLVSKIRRKKRIYDAHELFCEMKEIVTRQKVYKFWKKLERFTVPRFRYGYTVNEPICNYFRQDYGTNYDVIRNVPLLTDLPEVAPEQFIIYQGAVNQGRSFETLIPAFQYIEVPLFIYGDGNFLEEAKALVEKYDLKTRVIFKGKVLPQELKKITPRALLGLTLFENKGLSNYYSLANRFFDYIHACVPQVCVDYPVYKSINDHYGVAVLVNDLSPENLAKTINGVLENPGLLTEMRAACREARKHYNWQAEEQKLLHFYSALAQDRFSCCLK